MKLAICGGHQSTINKLSHTLQTDYGINKILTMPSSSAKNITCKKIKSRVANYDLVVAITGYTGHNMTEILIKLDRSQHLNGKLLIISSCRGESGILREILKYTAA